MNKNEKKALEIRFIELTEAYKGLGYNFANCIQEFRFENKPKENEPGCYPYRYSIAEVKLIINLLGVTIKYMVGEIPTLLNICPDGIRGLNWTIRNLQQDLAIQLDTLQEAKKKKHEIPIQT